MCGIVGIRRFDGRPVDPALLEAMANTLRHRGPDGDGVWARGSIGFGHRRLAIIDVGGSPQPMSSEGGRLHVCFNGEIFNYRALRRTLDYPFRTEGDTEVLLALHAQRGAAAVRELEGQFAYAHFDDDTEELWLQRDRLGILPLFWYADDRMFAFASEIKALLPALPTRPSVDTASLDAYLRHRSVPSPHTLVAGVRKIRPGHQLLVTRDGRIVETPYWTLPEAGTVDDISDLEARDRLRMALEHAVERNLVADVPIGTYLSGGLDSSLITALVARQMSTPVKTFAAGFGAGSVDELPFARTVSDALGTEHHEVVVGPEDFASLWTQLTWHRDAPLSEPADIAVYSLARSASEHVKVVLSGEGSDELFGGYPKHAHARITAWAGAIPMVLRAPILTAAERALPPSQRRLGVALRALAEHDADERRAGWFAPFTSSERRALLPREPSRQIVPVSGDPLRRMLASDLASWLPDNLLERGDRMTMAASVELRPPFLDREVVELAFRLPSKLKVRRGAGKWIVKEVARSLLPAEIIERPKSGFRVPLDQWFRGNLRELAWDRLLDPQSFVCTVFDRDVVTSMLNDHQSGRRNEDIRVWTLLSLELWHSTFVENATLTRP